MKDKLLIIGLGAFLTLFYFLISNYFSGFVTKAEYNEDMSILKTIQLDIEYIKKAVEKH